MAQCSSRPLSEHEEGTSVSTQDAEILAGGHKHMANCAVCLQICVQLKRLHARCVREEQREENVKIREGESVTNAVKPVHGNF